MLDGPTLTYDEQEDCDNRTELLGFTHNERKFLKNGQHTKMYIKICKHLPVDITV